MAKWANDTALDAFLDNLADRVTHIVACKGQPGTYASAVGANKLAIHALSAGDFSKANGDTSGRKLTIAQQTGATVSTTGTADHVALVTGSTLEYVTTATAQTLTSGNALTFNSWDIEIADPT